MKRNMLHTVAFAASVLALISLTAACASNSPSSTAQRGQTLTILNINPFTGGNAIYGQSLIAGCYPAVRLINQDGGVLGNKLRCVPVDTRSDPVDAVPAVQQAVATTSNLAGALGPDDEATLGGIVNGAHLPNFPSSGQDEFDHQTNPYFYRIHPTDDALGVAMAIYARQKGYTKAAAFFGNDVAAQGVVGVLLKAFKQLGGTIVSYQQVPEDQTSYGTEMAKMAAAHPQVIFTEEDSQSGATAFHQFQQSNNGLVPIIGTDATLTPSWEKAVSNAVGSAAFSKYYIGLEAYAPASGPAWEAYKGALMASAAQVPSPAQWATSEFSMWPYDATNLMALAMTEAKSTKPSTYNKYIRPIASGEAGAVVVHTFKEGKAELLAGKHIHYVGAVGEIHLNKYNNSQGDFEVANFINGQNNHISTVSGQAVGALLTKVVP